MVDSINKKEKSFVCVCFFSSGRSIGLGRGGASRERGRDGDDNKGEARDLGEVAVSVRIVWISLQVLTIDQRLDSLLDHLGVWLEESQLRQHLRDQLLMGQHLTSLQNRHRAIIIIHDDKASELYSNEITFMIRTVAASIALERSSSTRLARLVSSREAMGIRILRLGQLQPDKDKEIIISIQNNE